MERRDYLKAFRRDAIFKAAKNNTAGNFLTLLGIWFVSPHDEAFIRVFTVFALIVSIFSIVNLFLGFNYSEELEEKRKHAFEKLYYYSTGMITSSLGFFLVYQGHHTGFLTTAHLSTWVFVIATIEACASYLFHAPRFFILTYVSMHLPSTLWLLYIGTPTSMIIAAILVLYGPLIMGRVQELTKLRNQNVSLLEDSKSREEQLQMFIDMIPSKLLWINSDSMISLLNKKMEPLIRRKDIFMSRDYIGSSDDQLLNEIFKFLDSEETSLTKELLVGSSDGDRWHMCNFTKVDFRKGREAFIVAIDIHDDKVLKDSLIKQKQISDQASRLVNLGEMASGIAHEINNPIAIAQGTASVLLSKLEKSKLDDDDLKVKLEKIMSTHQRVTDVIKGMKAFSKKGTSEDRANVEIEDVIKSTLVLCSERFKDYGIDLRVEPLKKKFEYECRKQDLSQIILSFLNNSFDSISKKTENQNDFISIRVDDEDSELCISVTDSGVGIDNIEKVFVPFYTTKSHGTGVGLGLSLSQKIANSYSGRIEANSDNGRTTFRLLLPY
jgi:signal transduction histidine kinase